MNASILLVEDDLPLSTMIARYLRAHGHEVIQAGSTEEATARLHDGFRPSIVLLDINLPTESGWALLRDPEFVAAGSPPVVIACATNVSPTRLRESGAAGYLPKPFPMATLLDTVERLGRG